jgi:hypothetical protein
MLELGFNRTIYGKAILAACFINDLGTVIALGLIFSPFTVRTTIFLGAALFVFLVLPFATQWFFDRYGGRVSELETKYLLFLLFGLGGLAVWSGSEAVLPAYLIGLVLAGRDLPVMISVIDTDEKIAAAAGAIEGMLQDGLIVVSDVDMVRLVRSHTVTEAPHAAGTTR